MDTELAVAAAPPTDDADQLFISTDGQLSNWTQVAGNTRVGFIVPERFYVSGPSSNATVYVGQTNPSTNLTGLVKILHVGTAGASVERADPAENSRIQSIATGQGASTWSWEAAQTAAEQAVLQAAQARAAAMSA